MSSEAATPAAGDAAASPSQGTATDLESSPSGSSAFPSPSASEELSPSRPLPPPPSWLPRYVVDVQQERLLAAASPAAAPAAALKKKRGRLTSRLLGATSQRLTPRRGDAKAAALTSSARGAHAASNGQDGAAANGCVASGALPQTAAASELVPADGAEAHAAAHPASPPHDGDPEDDGEEEEDKEDAPGRTFAMIEWEPSLSRFSPAPLTEWPSVALRLCFTCWQPS